MLVYTYTMNYWIAVWGVTEAKPSAPQVLVAVDLGAGAEDFFEELFLAAPKAVSVQVGIRRARELSHWQPVIEVCQSTPII